MPIVIYLRLLTIYKINEADGGCLPQLIIKLTERELGFQGTRNELLPLRTNSASYFC